MKSHIQLISTVGMSQNDWLAYRANGIGASEMSCLLGLNQYKSSIELFYEKIGRPRQQTENLAMFFGKELEHKVADFWQFWAGSPESMIANFRAGNVQRKCQRVNAYVRNPAYPSIFVSLDRKINKHDGKEEGALEIKTISGWESGKWESGIPPGHVIQLQTQLMVCEFDYGEIAVLKDGRDMFVYPFEPMPEVQATIAAKAAEFWAKVEQGRVLMAQSAQAWQLNDTEAAEAIEAQIQALEPPPDGSASYADYLKEKYKNPQQGERLGTDEQFQWAVEHCKLSGLIKELETLKTLEENKLKSALGEVQVLDFGERGRVNWKENSKGSRVFTNKIKPPAEPSI